MFLRYRTLGFVFKKEDRGEADQIFKIFTKDFGKIEVLGKGIRKISSKLRSQIELFYLSEIEFVEGKIHKRLTDALLIEKFKNLRRDLNKLTIAYKIGELLDGLIKGQERDERILNLILETFKNLEKPTLPLKTCYLQYYYFFWNLISILGQRPEVYNCCLCQKRLRPEKLYFNEKEGGVVCPKCFSKTKEGRPIGLNLIKILRIIFDQNLSLLKRIKIDQEELEKLKEVSEFYFNFLAKDENQKT